MNDWESFMEDLEIALDDLRHSQNEWDPSFQHDTSTDNTAKILLLGKTGVGKSSFINYFLGKKVAKTGAGKPITPELTAYEVEGERYPIVIYDSKGIEALDAENQIGEIIETVRKRNNSDDVFNWFHTIFYCVPMGKKFEDFEINFIKRLHNEISQHIHIIITKCDGVDESTIQKMKVRITSELDNLDNIEIFEVVSVSKKKRDGSVVEPRGKEELAERVFDLLLDDIASRVSAEYARRLRYSIRQFANQMLDRVNHFIDEVAKPSSLWKFVQDEDALDTFMDTHLEQIEEKMEEMTQQIDERFNEILQPIAQLYTSYVGIATDNFVNYAQLDFVKLADWSVGDFFDKFDDKAIMEKVAPDLHHKGYIGKDGEFADIEDGDLLGNFKMIWAGVNDIFFLKRNLKNFAKSVYDDFMDYIPPKNQLQEAAYNRIVQGFRASIAG